MKDVKINKLYYILFLILSGAVILFLAIANLEIHSSSTKYLAWFAVFALVLLRFVKEQYKNIAHVVFILVFIVLAIALRMMSGQ